MEEQNIYPPGSLVQVTSYSPFRGLNGTIQTVDTISDDREEPIWFEDDEVELITSPLVALEA